MITWWTPIWIVIMCIIFLIGFYTFFKMYKKPFLLISFLIIINIIVVVSLDLIETISKLTKLIIALTATIFIIVIGIGIGYYFVKKQDQEDKKKLEMNKADLASLVKERLRSGYINYNQILTTHHENGNVIDPLGVLHDENGMPVYLKNEKLISKIDNVELSINIPEREVFKNAGVGTLYNTNMRMIYVREPSPSKQMQNSSLGIVTGYTAALWSKQLKRNGRKEGASIPIGNIVSCNKKKKKVTLQLQDKMYRYTVWIKSKIPFPSQFLEEIPKVGRIIGKRAEQQYIKPTMVRCPHCQTSFQITPIKRPFRVKCPKCSKESMLR